MFWLSFHQKDVSFKCSDVGVEVNLSPGSGQQQGVPGAGGCAVGVVGAPLVGRRAAQVRHKLKLVEQRRHQVVNALAAVRRHLKEVNGERGEHLNQLKKNSGRAQGDHGCSSSVLSPRKQTLGERP